MSDPKTYSARAVFDGMKGTLHRYLEAQYHIWNESLIEGRKRLLETEGVTFQEPRIEATPFYVGEHICPDADPCGSQGRA